MRMRFNVDLSADANKLMRRTSTEDGMPQLVQRPPHLYYGSENVVRMGAVPFAEAYPDKLVDPKDYKERIAYAIRSQIFAVYHQNDKKVFEKGWNQNGLGYCWTWSLTAALMGCRVCEGYPHVLLAPTTQGYLVNWRNQGNYLLSALGGARQRGIAPASYVPNPHSINPNTFKEGWEQAALSFKLREYWDTQRSSIAFMIQQCLSILVAGRPLYIAYNWWSHALECCGLIWDESVKHNLIWVIRNSHGEAEEIELTGDRAVPDEAYGIRASELPSDEYLRIAA